MNKRVTADDPRVPELVRVYRETKSSSKAARAVGMNNSRACKILRELGESKPRPAYDDILAKIRQLVAQNMSIRQISQQLGIKYDAARDLVAKTSGEYVMAPNPHRVFGTIADDPDKLAPRIADFVTRYGAAALIRSREGRIAAAIPGTRVYLQAEREDAIVCTYAAEADTELGALTGSRLRRAIAEDIRYACEGVR